MRGFTAHEARGRNLPLTSLKRAQRRFCCGNVPLFFFFSYGAADDFCFASWCFCPYRAVKTARRPCGFDLRFSEKLCFGVLHRM